MKKACIESASFLMEKILRIPQHAPHRDRCGMLSCTMRFLI